MSTPTAPIEVGNGPKKPSLISVDELVKIMEANTLQDDPREKRTERSSKLVKAYLIQNEPEFVRVMGFRDRVSCVYQSGVNLKGDDAHTDC